MRCDAQACFCSHPPTRRVQSTRALYTLREVHFGGRAQEDDDASVRWFVYLYFDDGARP